MPRSLAGIDIETHSRKIPTTTNDKKKKSKNDSILSKKLGTSKLKRDLTRGEADPTLRLENMYLSHTL